MIFVLVTAPFASADVVELKTGETVQGVLKEVNGTKVVIEVGGQSIAFERAKVRAFHVGAPPPGAVSRGVGEALNSSPATLATSEAMRALKGLQSITAGSKTDTTISGAWQPPTLPVTYDQYAPRVLDAKVMVDRFLAESSQADVARVGRNITEALHFYTVGSTALKRNLDNRAARFGIYATQVDRDSIFEACSDVQQHMSDYRRDGGTITFDASGRFIFDLTIIPVIWSCASSKVAEAEQILRDDARNLPAMASTSQPPVTSAPPNPLEATPGGQQAGRVRVAMATTATEPTPSYLQFVESRLGARWAPPTEDARNSQVSVVLFTLDRDGRVKGVMVEKTSGSKKFDELAVRAVIDSQPGPALPRNRPEQTVMVRATFSR